MNSKLFHSTPLLLPLIDKIFRMMCSSSVGLDHYGFANENTLKKSSPVKKKNHLRRFSVLRGVD